MSTIGCWSAIGISLDILIIECQMAGTRARVEEFSSVLQTQSVYLAGMPITPEDMRYRETQIFSKTQEEMSTITA